MFTTDYDYALVKHCYTVMGFCDVQTNHFIVHKMWAFWGWISGSRAGTRWPMWAFGTLNAAEQASKWPVVYPGTHMTLLFGDLMYKLWYVCEFSKLIWCFRWEMNMCWAGLCVFSLLRHKARKPSHQLRWRPQIMWLRWVRLSNTNTVGAVRKVAEQS